MGLKIHKSYVLRSEVIKVTFLNFRCNVELELTTLDTCRLYYIAICVFDVLLIEVFERCVYMFGRACVCMQALNTTVDIVLK